MYDFISANQFCIDLCLETISVIDRTNKYGYVHTPYALLTGEHIDYERDFGCNCGELVNIKKPKMISSDHDSEASYEQDGSPESVPDRIKVVCIYRQNFQRERERKCPSG